MSVITTADEKLDSARQNTEDALHDMTEIVINRCWGYDEFKPECKDKMKKAFDFLQKARNQLDW